MKPLNILVAEDNTVNQLIVRGMLVKLGHNITMVENGKLALEKLQTSEIGRSCSAKIQQILRISL